MIKNWKSLKSFIGLLTLTVAMAVGLGFKTPVSAVASGCNASHPTAITGTIYGYGGQFNNWSVNAQVGMDLMTSKGVKVDINGVATQAGYSYSDYVNPTLAQPGASSGYDRTFGANLADGNGVLCVASNITSVYFEVYPKNGNPLKTDTTYYGGANDQNMPISVGATNSYTLRLPVGHSYGGNTGDVNGYITYQGHKVDPTKLNFRAWPTSPGTACGVQGFSGGGTAGYSASLDATYYLIHNLAGGQCGASYQTYKIRVICNSVCGATQRVIDNPNVNVANGARPRVDFKF